MASPKLYDVLIIGGGPAGLSLAGALARQLHTALILDSCDYRNERSKHMHNVAGWDHVDPAGFRAKARHDLESRYASIEYKQAAVRKVQKVEDRFEVVDYEGTVYTGRKLGLATGVRDIIDDEVEGYIECWGRGIFHCLFCHGFEERGSESAGVLSTSFLEQSPADLVHIARMAKRLSKRVTIYTNGNEALGAQVSSLVQSSKVHVNSRAISRLKLVDTGPQVRIEFADGSKPVTEGFLTSHPKMEQRAKHLIEQLDIEMTEVGDIKVSLPFNETSVKGCFAAGDCSNMMKTVIDALHMGVFAGVGCVSQLQEEMEASDEL